MSEADADETSCPYYLADDRADDRDPLRYRIPATISETMQSIVNNELGDMRETLLAIQFKMMGKKSVGVELINIEEGSTLNEVLTNVDDYMKYLNHILHTIDGEL